jgi:hypothetical protein
LVRVNDWNDYFLFSINAKNLQTSFVLGRLMVPSELSGMPELIRESDKLGEKTKYSRERDK